MSPKQDRAALAEARKAEKLKAQRKEELKRFWTAAIAVIIIALFIGGALMGIM